MIILCLCVYLLWWYDISSHVTKENTCVTSPVDHTKLIIDVFLQIRLLHQAALWDNAELLEDLLTSSSEELACLNARDSWGRTALHAAATNDDSQCLRILVQVKVIAYL